MAIKACRDCGGKVSTSAEVCPHCGVRSPTVANPLTSLDPDIKEGSGKKVSFGAFVVIVILVVVVFGAIFSPKKEKSQEATVAPKASETPEQKAKKAAEEAQFQRDVLAVKLLRSGMKNPDSFKLEQALRMPDGTLCLTYRATNSFNAIVPGHAVVSKDRIATSDSGGAFTSVWNKLCANKNGTDITYIRQAVF
jgi:hypothetical protein